MPQLYPGGGPRRLQNSSAATTFTVNFGGVYAVAVRFQTPWRSGTKALSAVSFLPNAAASNVGLKIEIFDTGAGIPGSNSQGSVTATVNVSVNTLFTQAISPTIELQPQTTYWAVISVPNGTTNLVLLKDATANFGSPPWAMLTTTSGTFTALASQPTPPVFGLTYSDGTEHYSANFFQISSIVNSAQNGQRMGFSVDTGCDFHGCTVNLGRTASPGSLTFALADLAGNVIQSVPQPTGNVPSSSNGLTAGCEFDPVRLRPGLPYYLWVEAASVDGSNYYRWGRVSALPRPLRQGPFNVFDLTARTAATGLYDTDRLSTDAPPWDLSLSGFGLGSGFGTYSRDTVIKDGASGASLRMRAGNEISDYSLWREYYVGADGTQTYTVKVRRESAAVPALAQIRLWRFGAARAVTITAGSPGTLNATGHRLANDTPVLLRWASQPTGLTASRFDAVVSAVYYVVNSTANTLQLATTPGGAAVAITGTGSGVTVEEWQYGAGQKIAEMTIEANANDTFYTYSSSALDLRAKDLILVEFTTRLALPGQAADLHFDSEVFA